MKTAKTAPQGAAPTTDDRHLVEAARNGDDGAFGALVRRHQQRVFRLAGRFFRKREDVEDVAQETFLIAWEKLPSFRGEAPFEHWLTRLCLNCCYGRLRKKKVLEEPFSADVEAPSSSPDARIEVQRLLRRLSVEDRFILLLLDGEGWSVAEIADKLGWSRVNVKVRAHRARKRLRALLNEESKK